MDAKPVRPRPMAKPKIRFEPLPPMRLAEPFEALARPSDDRCKAAASGRRCFSPISARPPTSPRARPSPRASSRAGGIEAVDSDGFVRCPASARRRFKASGAASPASARRDKVYASDAVAAAKALASRRRQTYLSGRPARRAGGALRGAGVNELHLRRRRRPGDAAEAYGGWSDHDRRRQNPY